MNKRRELDFRTFDEINTDVKSLLSGHHTVGIWTLSEILSHLTKAVRLSMRSPRERVQPTPEFDESRTRFFLTRRFSEGRPLPGPILAPNRDHSAEEGAEGLQSALEKYLKYDGDTPAHPYLGPLTHQEWIQFHCIHCAHHLSFAIPNE